MSMKEAVPEKQGATPTEDASTKKASQESDGEEKRKEVSLPEYLVDAFVNFRKET